MESALYSQCRKIGQRIKRTGKISTKAVEREIPACRNNSKHPRELFIGK
jgi:hypothetical protein